MSSVSPIKTEAQRIVEQLPEDASWEDLIYRIYVRQAIEAGLQDAEAGDMVPIDEVRRQFRLKERWGKQNYDMHPSIWRQ